ncbi:MAG TPA: hypothetical protein H9875_06520 [Candidatus Levilactobacillus faecigallinarum]|uniref:Uncharacterized protein n=1 Tax=Candidatus Levilactobacillus faecigallinarum TaxID=2838638 RepID=A0A9D1U5B2_9LACO|nr:hypothetical protein [Candidatus Levilactobacillus faecigallinarum]
MHLTWQHWLTLATVAGGLSVPQLTHAAAVPAKDNVYHLTPSKKTVWAWNKAHTQKLAAINQTDSSYEQRPWYVDDQVTLTVNGKKAVYYHVTSGHLRGGYVWRGALTKGYPAKYSQYGIDTSYYRLETATAVTYDRHHRVTLPKGTLIAATISLQDRKWTASFNLGGLSAPLKQQLGLAKDATMTDDRDMAALEMTKVTQPKFSLPALTNEGQALLPDFLVQPRTQYQPANQGIRFTVDGYLEFYHNGQPQSTFNRPIGVPISRRILDLNDSGNLRTVVYEKAIPGLPGRPTTYQGKPAFQLTITLNPKIEREGDEGLAHYQLNGQTYNLRLPYTFFPTALPDPVSRLTDKEFAKTDHMYYNHDKFYRAKRAVKLKVPYTAYNGNDIFYQTLTIPKGTVVAADQDNRNPLGVYTDRLEQCLVKGIYQKHFYLKQQIAKANPRDFQRIKRPNYLPAWSRGDLYLGANQAIHHRVTKRSAQNLQITPNGYVEVRQNTTTAPETTYRAKPTQSVKIQRTLVKHHTRYLYLTKPLKGFKTPKVTTQGKVQYRLALTNTHKYRYVVGEENITYYALYSAGGKSCYTPLGTTHD